MSVEPPAEPGLGLEGDDEPVPGPDARPAADAASEEEPPPRRYVREYFETLLVAILIVLFGTTFLVQNSVIPSASMEDTLLVGDYLFVNKVVFSPVDGDRPERWLAQRPLRHGDVVVFRFPPDPQVDYIKRVIGLPGDTIEIRDKQLWRNGQSIDEPYKVHATAIVQPRERSQRDNLGPLVVPEDHYFVLGDNRDYSADSREWQFVPRSHVTGRALLVFWSRDVRTGQVRTSGVPTWRTVLDALRSLPVSTRWERIGTVVE